ncbi:two pore calcium channel protein 1 isoform X1 [Dermacentor silvarum]|uniref:two pore calcium channel protein 1 isoform X1 n=1 Tax=Dermacentor silvarum TaxID=543639 RepID=UPI001896B62C|nr:two pore calcium channel protein 1 isoform X1 [Dermacentor silvarum]
MRATSFRGRRPSVTTSAPVRAAGGGLLAAFQGGGYPHLRCPHSLAWLSRAVKSALNHRRAVRNGAAVSARAMERVSLAPEALNRRLSLAAAVLKPPGDSASPTEDNTPSGSYSSFDAVVRDRILQDKKTDVDVRGEPTVTFRKDGEQTGIDLEAKDALAQLRVGEDAPVLERDLILASALVRDAMESYHSDFKMTEKAVRIYNIYHHWGLQLVLYIFILINHLLAVFERPAVHGCELPIWGTMLIEFICLSFYTFRLAQAASFSRAEVFWKDPKNLVVIGVVGVTLIDMVIFSAMEMGGLAGMGIRCTRPLRPFLMVNFAENKQVRRAVRNIRNTLKEIIYALILLFMSIALFSLLALKLFQRRSLFYPDGRPYFKDYFDIYFSLYVLITTANHPDVMMPAYNDNSWFALFFVVYTLICLYIFMNIILAVIYYNYRENLKVEVQNMVGVKRDNLSRAFDLLKVRDGDSFVITYSRFVALLDKIPPARSEITKKILWYVLDQNGDNKVDLPDFMYLADLLNVQIVETEETQNCFERFMPSIYNCVVSQWIRTVTAHLFFRYLFDLLILVNAIVIGLDVYEAEWFFLTVFSVEILLKIYAFGFIQFMKQAWNVFDVVIIGSAVIGTLYEVAIGASSNSRTLTLDILLVLRVLRLVKLIRNFKKFRGIINTITNLGPSILTFGGVLFAVYYVYAVIGMELYRDKITFYGGFNGTHSMETELYCGNAKLKQSTFYATGYCKNNFNDIFSSFVVLFELMVVNQWHILTEGFVHVTSKAARLYFLLFHLSCVVIVLNIFTAFVLEAFLLEYTIDKTKLESAVETKIGEMGLKFGKHQRKKNLKDESGDGKSEFPGMYVDSDHNILEDSLDKPDTARNPNVPDMSDSVKSRFHIMKKRRVEDILVMMFEDELEELEIMAMAAANVSCTCPCNCGKKQAAV